MNNCLKSDASYAAGLPPMTDKSYRALVDAAVGCAIYMLDPTGVVMSWNAGANLLTGYDAAEIVGQHVSRFYTFEDRGNDMPRQVLALAASQNGLETEGWRLRRDGSRFWAKVAIAPMRSAAGDLLGFASFSNDISEAHETRIALDHAREAMFQLQKMEAIGMLAAGVAHDFNNILQAIVGSLELVLDGTEEAAPSHAIACVAINLCMRGSSLTHHLLSYARKQSLRPQLVDVASLLGETKALLSRTLGPQIAISITAEPGPAVLADPGQLQTAVLNLAINASHAMPQGGTLSLSTGQNDAVAGWITITVADTGCGMDAETLARVTEPFYTTKGTAGSGLGLSMVQGFADQSGGTLRIESTPGRGTSITLCLPSAEAKPQFNPPQTAACTRHARVLLVDDATEVLSNMASALEIAGYGVARAENGAGALALLASGQSFDVLVTDHAMPGMTGAQLIAAARLVQPDLRFVQMTGHAGIGCPDSVDTGIMVLHKPFQRQDLIAVLQHTLGRGDAAPDDAAGRRWP